MNYKESEEILEKIKSSNKILINCHHNPDADSVGSATAMYRVLCDLGKGVKILCPSNLPESLKFLPNADEIEKTDFSKFNYSDYDLFITLDSASWNRVSGSHEVGKPDIPMIVIDHHISNQKYGNINLVIADSGSNAEIMFNLFEDWEIDITSDIATSLLTGIVGDTGGFRYPDTTKRTLEIATELMEVGADEKKIMFNLYQSYEIERVQFWAEVLSQMEVDKDNKFAYSLVANDTYKKYGSPQDAKGKISNMFFQSIKGTDFGFVGVQNNGYMSVSFRSRTGKDVSIIASRLGGGGHKWASAARINLSFEEAKTKLLDEAIKFAQEKD